MKFRTQKITALMASAIVGVSTLGSVSVMAAESTEAMADQAGMVVDRDAIAADGDAIPSDFIQGTFGNQSDRNGGHLIGYGGLISVPVV